LFCSDFVHGSFLESDEDTKHYLSHLYFYGTVAFLSTLIRLLLHFNLSFSYPISLMDNEVSVTDNDLSLQLQHEQENSESLGDDLIQMLRV